MTKTTFTVEFSETDDQWYWHATRKGRIVCDGGEGYKRKAALVKSLKALLRSIEAGAFNVVEK